MKVLHVYNRVTKKYYDIFSIYASDKPDPYDLDEKGESDLAATVESYDWVHFWDVCSLPVMEAAHATSAIVSCTSPFGRKIFAGWEKPFDLQFHVSRTALANYLKGDVFSYRCENTLSYLPIRTEVFDPSKYDREQVRSELGFSVGDLVICRSGRSDVWKWDMFLVELLTKMKEEVKALIIGGVPDFIEKALVQRDLMGIVKIIPYEPHFPQINERNAELLSACDLYVHSSFIGESCGVSILEAMSMKKTVIVTNTPWADNAPAEYIDNGVNGYLCDDIQQASQVIMKPRDPQMGERARARVLERFEAGKVVRRMEDAVRNASKSRAVVDVPKSYMVKHVAQVIGTVRRRNGLL